MKINVRPRVLKTMDIITPSQILLIGLIDNVSLAKKEVTKKAENKRVVKE